MMQNTLTLFPYYGGKARFASFISGLLDYEDTEIYIEPFGGAASVLLNKPRHLLEIYNDNQKSLCTLMQVLADEDMAEALIERLHDLVYSETEFNYAKMVCDSVDVSCVIKSLKRSYQEYRKEIHRVAGAFNENDVDDLKAGVERFKQLGGDGAAEVIRQYALMRSYFDKHLNIEQEFIHSPPQYSEIEIAAAAYIQYSFSRDGMGLNFSSSKFKNQAAYQRRLERLYDVADRLKGVDVRNTCVEILIQKMAKLFTRPEVMAYLDPPYLSVDAEARQGKPKDLGAVYRQRMVYDEHKAMLEIIRDAKCKILISNYDNELYNDYLDGWAKIEIPTTTSVGGKKNNKRVEVLWFNY